MELAAQGGFVRFETRLIATEVRLWQALWDRRVSRTGASVRVCGWCNRVECSTEWLEVEDAVRRLGLFEPTHPPACAYALCPSCRETIQSTYVTEN